MVLCVACKSDFPVALGMVFRRIERFEGLVFAPLYDLVITVYYPELSKKMAMKIGGETESLKVSAEPFERLAIDAGLTVPMVKKRVPELAEQVLANLNKVKIPHPVANELAELIEQRCKIFIAKF